MFKIFSYCGSAQYPSISNNISREFLLRLTNTMEKEFSIKHYKCDQVKIDLVNNVNQFVNPQEAMNTPDDMQMIANQMLNSNMIVFSTPVYFKNVSAGMKVLLDRITGWTHSFELVGKFGVCIVCGSQNGSKETLKYMEDFMIRLGLGSIQFIEYNTNNNSVSELNQKINISVNTLVDRINNSRPPLPTDRQIEIYENYKKLFLTEGINEAEHKIWIEKQKNNENLNLKDIMGKEFC